MSIQPDSGPAGTTFVVKIAVRNIGAGTAPGGVSQLLQCTLDGVVYGPAGTSTNAPYETLSTGMSLTHERRILTTNSVPGAKTFECTVDRRNGLQEAVEDNNTHEVTFVVASPDDDLIR